MQIRRTQRIQKDNWKLLLFSSVMLTMIFFRYLYNGRIPRTLIIYNNENLCASRSPSGNNHHRSKSLAASEATQTTMVIVIPSCQNNFRQRSLIRQTYGSIRSINNVNIVALVFMLGNIGPNDEKSDIGKLEAEYVRYGDIIVGDFLDSYRNLSRKAVMAYEWLTSFCQSADLVVKTDDDVMVDIFKLTAELGRLPPSAFDSSNFWCAVHTNEGVIREKESIYYISYEEYAKEEIPQHCAGVGYVTQMGVIHRIADEISKSFLGPICTHEDIFMTGIVVEKINSYASNPITYVDRRDAWVFYVDERNPNQDGAYIWSAVTEPANKTDDLDEFRQRSGTRIFYLIQHDDDFERKFLRLWTLVKNSHQNYEISNKIQIN